MAGLHKLSQAPLMHAWWAHALLIVAVWSALHLATLSWGLPSTTSLAPDAIPVELGSSPIEYMQQDAIKYPPLQYIIWQVFGPDAPPKGADQATILAANSAMLWSFRLIVALLSLATALGAWWLGRYHLQLATWSLIAPILFIVNPVSLFYSHTTNMDQPFTAWLMLSLIPFAIANFPRTPTRKPAPPASRQERRKQKRLGNDAPAPAPRAPSSYPRAWLLGNALFAIFMACSFCTKDQVYGIYPLPLAAFLIWRFRHGNTLKKLLIQAALWVAPFFLTVFAVYQTAAILMVRADGAAGRASKVDGAVDVFKMHAEWLVNSARTGFEQVGTGLLDRLKLFWLSLQSLCSMLEWPMTLALIALIIIVIRQRQTLWADRRLRAIATITGLAWFSYVLLFVQTTRYTFERYYLIFIIPLAWLIAIVLQHLYRQASRLPARPLACILILLTSLLGIQLLHTLLHDSRIIAVPTLIAQLDDPTSTPTIGLQGKTWGHVYYFHPQGNQEKRMIRDWSTTRLPHTDRDIKGIMIDPLYLDLHHPDWIIGYQADDHELQILADVGYQHVTTITSPKPWLWRSFTIDSPTITLHRLTTFIPPDTEALRSRTLADQLLVLLAAFDGSDPLVLKHVGTYLQDFDLEALDGIYLTGSLIEWTAVAYDLNHRVDTAERTFRYLLMRWKDSDNPSFHQNWLRFCRKNHLNPQLAP